MKKFLRQNRSPRKLSIFVTDDPWSDKAPAIMAGFGIYVPSEKLLDRMKVDFKKGLAKLGIIDYPGDIHLDYKEARRDDMRRLVDYVQRWDMLTLVCYLRPPERELELYNVVTEIKRIDDEIQKERDIETNRQMFLNLVANGNKTLVDLLFPILHRDVLCLDEPLAELEITKDVERIKSLTSTIISRLEAKVPPMNAPKTFGKDLRGMVEERMKKFGGFEWFQF
jgi:hypothetical protein